LGIALVKLIRVVCRETIRVKRRGDVKERLEVTGRPWADAILVFSDDGKLIAVHCPTPCPEGCYFFRRITKGPPK